MLDRFDNWLMDVLIRLFIAASRRYRRRVLGRADLNVDGVRFLDADGGRAVFDYSYRSPKKAPTFEIPGVNPEDFEAVKVDEYYKPSVPVNGTIAEVFPVDEGPDPGLERVVMWSLSDDEISVSLPVKYTRERLTDCEIKDLLSQMADIARRRIRYS